VTFRRFLLSTTMLTQPVDLLDRIEQAVLAEPL